MKITENNVSAIMQGICADPYKYNAAATGRVVKMLEPYIIRQRPIKSEFKSINSIEWIDFANDSQKKFYDTYYKRYLEETAKSPNSLSALNKFAQAAEIVRAEQLADSAYLDYKDGKAVLLCAKYKDTLVQVMMTLNKKYNISFDRMSMIWGGISKTQLDALERRKALREKLSEDEMLLLEELNLSSEVAATICPISSADAELRKRFFRLQSMEERQANIDAFQNEKTDFCFYTAAAGGVALSLHAHAVWSRPRSAKLTPCWSDHQLIQTVGRGHRVTSKSNTRQSMMCFKGTVEESIAATYRKKMQGLLKVIGKNNQSWIGLATDKYNFNQLEFDGQENFDPDFDEA